MSTGAEECGYCNTDHDETDPCPVLDAEGTVPPAAIIKGVSHDV